MDKDENTKTEPVLNPLDRFIDGACKWFLHFFKNEKTRNKLAKIFNLELVTYIIAGFLTTVVNWIVSYLLNDIAGVKPAMLSGAVAWVAAVAFSYWINAVWVFKSRYTGFRDELSKIGKFTLSRVVTGLIEIFCMGVFVDLLGMPFWPVKIAESIIIIILNYVFSKLFVFMKEKNPEGTEEKK